MNWDIFWNGVSALATTGAVIVALDLAGKEEKRRKESEEAAAQLSAASIEHRLSTTHALVSSLIARIVFNDAPYDPDFVRREAVREIQRTLAKPFFKPTPEHLIALIPLGGAAAHRLAKAFDLIGSTADLVGGIDADALNMQQLDKLLDSALTTLKGAAEYLQTALTVCEKASEKGAPGLTLEERYGPEFD